MVKSFLNNIFHVYKDEDNILEKLSNKKKKRIKYTLNILGFTTN